MTIEEKALNYLEKDTLAHIDMIEVIKRGFADIHYAGDDGVAMAEKKGGVQYLSVTHPKAGERLLSFFNERVPVMVHQDFLADRAVEKLKLAGYNKCREFTYLKKEKTYTEVEGIEICKLSMEWLDEVSEIYHLIDNPEYIRLLLEEGVMHGAFIEGELAGFIGMHTEGCMGLLEVLPEYRRRGIGEILERYMIDWNLERGFVPFCQVFTDNEASLRLQEKLGLTPSDKYLWWVY
ncbi:MAG: GNAT family N-acetyltransferase [Acetivibrio ethanolgignens]